MRLSIFAIWGIASVLLAVIIGLTIHSQNGKSDYTVNMSTLEGVSLHDIKVEDVQNGIILRKVIEVINKSERAFRVQQVIGSCACTNATTNAKIIWPDDSILVAIEIDTSAKRGNQITETVTLIEEGVEPRSVRINIVMKFLKDSDLIVEPLCLRFPSIDKQHFQLRRFKVRRMDWKEIGDITWEISNSAITIKRINDTICRAISGGMMDTGQAYFVVTIDKSVVDSNNFNEEIVLSTINGKRAILKVLGSSEWTNSSACINGNK